MKFIRIFMSNVIWYIVNSDDMYIMLMRSFDYGQKVTNTSQKHQFFLFHRIIIESMTL